MAQTLVNIRMDEDLKKNMEQICQELGMNEKIWFDEAWEDYVYWQTQDKRTL